MVNLPFDERNKKDFEALTQRLADALNIIKFKKNQAGEYEYKPTVKTLCELAECSPATLYTRKNPINPIKCLMEIKEQRINSEMLVLKRKRPRVTKEHLKSVQELVEQKKQLIIERTQAMNEVVIYSKKNADLKIEKAFLERQVNALTKINQELEEKITNLINQNSILTTKLNQKRTKRKFHIV